MNVLSKRMLLIVVIFFSATAILVHADFCSSKICTHNSECYDSCSNGYWYYGSGNCCSDCYFSDSKHCQYTNRVCADSDASDGFPDVDCHVRSCSAECDQNTDCSCPADGCVGSDYYDHSDGACGENCKCSPCEPVVTINDSRCAVSFIEVSKTAEPVELVCEQAKIKLTVTGVGIGTVGTNLQIIDFLPSYANLETSLNECEYESVARKITCNLNNLTAGETKTVEFNLSLNQSGHLLVDTYPNSGLRYIDQHGNETFVSFPETYVDVSAFPGNEEICNDTVDNNCNGLIDLNDTTCYQCQDNDSDGFYNNSILCPVGNDCNDSNPNIGPNVTETCDDAIDNNCDGRTDCEDSACSSFSSCNSNPGESVGSVVGGGGGFGGMLIKTVVCGNNKCEGAENCFTCPKDCLKEGQVCCGNVSYYGVCCLDIDCGKGYECNLTKSCNPVFSMANNQTGQSVQSGCQEDWVCTDWSECRNNIRTRECVDKNACGTAKNIPIEVEGCEVTENPLSGLFLLATSLPGFLSFIILISLILLFLWRRKKKQA